MFFSLQIILSLRLSSFLSVLCTVHSKRRTQIDFVHSLSLYIRLTTTNWHLTTSPLPFLLLLLHQQQPQQERNLRRTRQRDASLYIWSSNWNTFHYYNYSWKTWKFQRILHNVLLVKFSKGFTQRKFHVHLHFSVSPRSLLYMRCFPFYVFLIPWSMTLDLELKLELN